MNFHSSFTGCAFNIFFLCCYTKNIAENSWGSPVIVHCAECLQKCTHPGLNNRYWQEDADPGVLKPGIYKSGGFSIGSFPDAIDSKTKTVGDVHFTYTAIIIKRQKIYLGIEIFNPFFYSF
jgi:hypothetical protein